MSNLTRRFTTTTTGPFNEKPVAVLATSKIDTLIGSIIQLDGRGSYDRERSPLTFKWSFKQIPVGSKVEDSGFKDLRPNSTAVSFIPDKIGLYLVELVVSDGELDSDPATASVNIQLTRVPIGENLVPDLRFLWNYISDFWNLVEDREKITTIWSSVVQLIGAELIKLWSNDYNKSFATIQSTYQRRWQAFDMTTDLSAAVDQRVIVGNTDSGVGGASGNIGVVPGVGNTAVFYLPLGRVGDGDKTDFTVLKGNYGPKGRVIVVDGVAYTIARVQNQDQAILAGTDLVTTLGSNVVSSATGFGTTRVGDILTIKTGNNPGSYKVKAVGPTLATLVYPADPPGGPIPSFQNNSDLTFTVARKFSLAIVSEAVIPEGLVGASWRVPHLLHVPDLDLETAGTRAGDILVLEVSRADIGLTTEVQAQVVGADYDRVGFELTMQELDPLVNSGAGAYVVESGGKATVTGLANMSPLSVGGYLEILDGANPGTFKIRQYISEDVVVIDHILGTGTDPGNPLRWVERARTGGNLERALFQKIVRDLRIVPASAGDQDVAAAAEALLSFVPKAINLSTRPFSKFGITFKAKRIIHNTAIKVSDELTSAPVLQESVVDPPMALRENFDYLIESGYLTFLNGLFTLSSPAPETLWAECAFFDNSAIVERNFGRLVNLSRDDLSQKKTRAPYLSAVKGLFFAYTNGPTMANLRLGLQILLGLPFAEEQGVILEVQDNFTVDTDGNALGRVLVEDIDDSGVRLGTRRIYLYSGLVGLEDNPSTLLPYAAGDTIARFAPISKGVEVVDYVKDPLWWKRSLYGLEVLKYFTFKVVVDGKIFDNNDTQFALEFIRAIKPAYTRVLCQALLDLGYDDIGIADALGGKITLKFYTSPWGYEATSRTNDQNQQGASLWNVGSYPFATRTLHLLDDVQTHNVSGAVWVTSAAGWDASLLRVCQRDPTALDPTFEGGRLPTVEADILAILPSQPGAFGIEAGLYEIDYVADGHNMRLSRLAGSVDQDLQEIGEVLHPALNPAIFPYGSGLKCCILRREAPTALCGSDLVTDGTNVVQSATALFLKNNVRVGDRLCVEYGSNLGEYFIDALVNQGSAAVIADLPVSGEALVTGLSGMTLDSEDGYLEFLSGLNVGVYKIIEYVSPTSVLIRHPGALVDSGMSWREMPRPPYFQEGRIALKHEDGSPANLLTGSSQKFRVVRAGFHRSEVYRLRYWYNASPLGHILEGRHYGYGNSLDGEWRDLFTPGMVGLPISVNESINPANNGEFIITEYINSGRVAISSSSTTSESSRGQRVNFRRAP
jgi:hypothetical protein